MILESCGSRLEMIGGGGGFESNRMVRLLDAFRVVQSVAPLGRYCSEPQIALVVSKPSGHAPPSAGMFRIKKLLVFPDPAWRSEALSVPMITSAVPPSEPVVFGVVGQLPPLVTKICRLLQTFPRFWTFQVMTTPALLLQSLWLKALEVMALPVPLKLRVNVCARAAGLASKRATSPARSGVGIRPEG
jgi:hypothetical protein